MPISSSHIEDAKKKKGCSPRKMISSFNAAMFRNMVKALIFDAKLAWINKWLLNLSGSVLD